jgi:hypothetical protein
MTRNKRTLSHFGIDDNISQISRKLRVTTSITESTTASDTPTLQRQKEAKQRVLDALSEEDAKTYQRLYNSPAKGKNATQSVRDRAVQRLQEFLTLHPNALKPHNEFADIFNTRSKQHIPVATFYELEEDDEMLAETGEDHNDGASIYSLEAKGKPTNQEVGQATGTMVTHNYDELSGVDQLVDDNEYNILQASKTIRNSVTSDVKFLPDPLRPAYVHWLEYRNDPFPAVPPMFSECTLIARALGRGNGWAHDDIMKAWAKEQHSSRGKWHRENRNQWLGAEPDCTEETRIEWQTWSRKEAGMI